MARVTTTLNGLTAVARFGSSNPLICVYSGRVGKIYYGGEATPIDIEDRALAHLKVVIATKLRRGESFTVSWKHPEGAGGRSTIWLHPSIPLRFTFDEAEAPELSREWLEELANSAHSSGGIVLVAEHFSTGPVEVPS